MLPDGRNRKPRLPRVRAGLQFCRRRTPPNGAREQENFKRAKKFLKECRGAKESELLAEDTF